MTTPNTPQQSITQALENCRLLAARHRKEEWAQTVLRFCSEAGVAGSPLRAQQEAQAGELPPLPEPDDNYMYKPGPYYSANQMRDRDGMWQVRMRELQASQPTGKVLAWATEDGRVVPASTMEGARRDGGAMLSSLKAYTIPLIANSVQPVQAEPVAQVSNDHNADGKSSRIDAYLPAGTMLYVQPVPASEAMGAAHEPLEESTIRAMWLDHASDVIAFARAVEQHRGSGADGEAAA
jgi:hypothetical protein